MLGIDITNSGGGSKLLLDYLVAKLPKGSYKRIHSNFKLFGLEWLTREIHFFFNSYSKVFYWSNIGPLFPYRKHVAIVFVQNVLLVKCATEIKELLTFRYRILRLLFAAGIRNADIIVVQSNFLRKELIENFNVNSARIKVYPFYPEISRTSHVPLDNFVFYPSWYGNHKGYEILSALWREKSDLPLLKVCMNEDTFIAVFGCSNNVENLGPLSHTAVLDQINKCLLVVYPSRFESLGLGLLESVQLKKNVVVSDKDYSREFLKGVGFFDGSPEDLYRVLKRECSKEKVTSELLIENNIEKILNIF